MSMSNIQKVLFIFSLLFLGVISTEQNNEETIVYDINEDRTNSFDEYYNGNEDFLRKMQEGESDKCKSRDHSKESDFYWFAPAVKALLKEEGHSLTFSNDCFQTNIVTLEKLTGNQAVVRLDSQNANGYFCKDSYFLSTTRIQQLQFVFMKGTKRIVFKNLTPGDVADIRVNGLKLFGFCQGFFTSLKSLFKTLELYLGGFGSNKDSWFPFMRPKVPEYMDKANADFITRYCNFPQISRGKWGKKVIQLDESEIHSGDFIIISRFDGVDPLIMVGSGSRVGHTAVALRIDGELYVVESQAGWYWPKFGIQRNKWSDWIKWAENADYEVAILPLKEEYRAKFDEKKAYEWFLSVEGLNYGFHNFVFSWLDTEKDNWPAWIDPEALFTLISIFSRVAKGPADIMFSEGLNFRLGTKGLGLIDSMVEAASRGITAGKLFAIPEQYGWEYSDGKNFVCSCFGIALYRAGGVFGDLELLPNEFGPKDVYQLNIFDKTYKDRRPQVCKDADPELEYCQIMGRFRLTLNNYSTIEPYSHMNERCPSVSPHFNRPDGC